LGRERPQERVERRSRLTRRRPARSQAKRTVAHIRGGGEGRSSPAVINQLPCSKVRKHLRNLSSFKAETSSRRATMARISRVGVSRGREGASTLKQIASTRKAAAKAKDWIPSGRRIFGEEWSRSTRPERRKEACTEVRSRMLEEGSLLEVFAIDDDVRSEVVVEEELGSILGEWMTRVSRRLARKSTSLVRPSQGMQEPGASGSGGRPTRSLISSLLCLLQDNPTTTVHLSPMRSTATPGKTKINKVALYSSSSSLKPSASNNLQVLHGSPDTASSSIAAMSAQT